MKRLSHWAAIGVAAVVALATPASAGVVVYTYKGTISSVSDPGAFSFLDGRPGLFDLRPKFRGAIKVGDSFTLDFTRDDATPNASQYQDGPPFAQSGISGVVGASPVLARLEVAGLTIDVGDNPAFKNHRGSQRQIDFTGGIPTEEFGHVSQDISTDNNGIFFASFSNRIAVNVVGVGTNYLSGGDYHRLGDLNASTTPGFDWSGMATFDEEVFRRDNGNLIYSRYANLGFNLASLTVSGGVPEPSTWALMLLGFGGLGATLRARRVSVTRAIVPNL